MLRTIPAVAVLLALRLALPMAAPMQVSTPDAAYAAYAGGDDTAVARWVATLPPTAGPYGTLQELRADAPWNRMAAAFLLEVAAAHPHGGRATSALIRGRTIVLRRPARIGDNPGEDRFEILWHQTALAITQRHHSITNQEAYLEAVLPRFEEAARRGLLIDTRFALLQGVTAGEICCSGMTRITAPRSANGGVLPKPTLEVAIRHFDRAAEQPLLRTEALIRAGKLLFEGGLYADALARFEKVPADGDPALDFVRHLTHGRVLDALSRPADAVTAYQRAVDARPDAQLAAIGLAAAHLRAGHTAEAARIADLARRMPPVPGRGFHEFDADDYRFVPAWLTEIRRMRR